MSASDSGRKALGTSGETIVRAHLERLGWTILAMNYRCRAGEIDLVASEAGAEGPTLVFVEVKTRRAAACGTPSEAVDARKRRKLTAAAGNWLARHATCINEPICRFDVAEVFVGADGLARVEICRGAFGDET